MDPLTQGVLGAAAAQSFSTNDKKILWLSFIIGWLSGMAADLDVLIKSETNPLLAIEYHRHFTHSLFFIPFGALFCSALFWVFLKKHISFQKIYLFSFLGFSTHGLLDACTSYGTQLLWPFSNLRVGWDLISVIDPLFTLPLLFGVALTLYTKRKVFTYASLAVAMLYLGICFIQRERAFSLQEQLGHTRQHDERSLSSVKPSFANIWLWKSIYLYKDTFYVDALWIFPFFEPKIYPGDSIKKFEPRQLSKNILPDTVLARDIELFYWFSSGYTGWHPEQAQVIGDLRYSFVPHKISPLWGILIDSKRPEQHAPFEKFRNPSKAQRHSFWKMLMKKNL